jgi:hypothetical protein
MQLRHMSSSHWRQGTVCQTSAGSTNVISLEKCDSREHIWWPKDETQLSDIRYGVFQGHNFFDRVKRKF